MQALFYIVDLLHDPNTAVMHAANKALSVILANGGPWAEQVCIILISGTPNNMRMTLLAIASTVCLLQYPTYMLKSSIVSMRQLYRASDHTVTTSSRQDCRWESFCRFVAGETHPNTRRPGQVLESAADCVFRRCSKLWQLLADRQQP